MPAHFVRSKMAGFTLIELLVTTAITSILMLTATSILMTFFLSNNRTAIRRQIKAEGSRAESKLEFIARGASDCSSIANGVRFTYPPVNGNSPVTYDVTKTATAIQVVTTAPPAAAVTEQLFSNFSSPEGSVTLQCVTEPNSTKKYANIKFDLTNSENSEVSESFSVLTVLRNSQ